MPAWETSWDTRGSRLRTRTCRDSGTAGPPDPDGRHPHFRGRRFQKAFRPGGPRCTARLCRARQRPDRNTVRSPRAFAREASRDRRDAQGAEIDLVSLEEDIDTASATDEPVFHVFAAIAHFERRLISERTKDGPLTTRKRGSTLGWPPLHADTISALHELVDNGMSVSKTARYLGIERSTAYRVIQETRP